MKDERGSTGTVLARVLGIIPMLAMGGIPMTLAANVSEQQADVPLLMRAAPLACGVAGQAKADAWYASTFGAVTNGMANPRLPFSFRSLGEDSHDRMTNWPCRVNDASGPLAETRILRFEDPATHLEVRFDVTRYRDYPAVEWVVHLRNNGATNTPILEDIAAIDYRLLVPKDQWCRVHTARGSAAMENDFEPLVYDMGPSAANPMLVTPRELAPLMFESSGGRSSSSYGWNSPRPTGFNSDIGTLPFFNVEAPGHGVILALGWTGDWALRMWRWSHGAVAVRGGMKQTHLALYPGEEIRTPRVLALFWEGDQLESQNLLRRFLLAHHVPRRNGDVLRAPISVAVWGENRAQKQLQKLAWFAENRIPVDNFWIDAGWYGDGVFNLGADTFGTEWVKRGGDWWPNAGAYPEGMRPIGQAARAAGMDFTLWVDAERAYAGTRATREHPEWFLGPRNESSLLNLGVPEARRYITEIVSGLVRDGLVTCYRQDFNVDPAAYWASNDAPDRVGMTEIRHIEGLYRFWDELLARHPGLMIDNCASGGRRIDLETISRSIPLWRSDYQCVSNFTAEGMQGQTQGLAPWVPLSTGCSPRQDDYQFRSGMGAGIVIGTDLNPTRQPEGNLEPWVAYDADWLRARVQEQRELRPFTYGDFYPLLPFTLSEEGWAAWQYHRPDLGAGVIQAFCRARSPYERVCLKLRGLEADATYAVSCPDDPALTAERRGRDLMDAGVVLTAPQPRRAWLVRYQRQGAPAGE
ncbi:MAG: alpha-galactosidase [Lentisphaerae bacterium]|nr:alpha-galactosidase [Lentisphaerota bacterium]